MAEVDCPVWGPSTFKSAKQVKIFISREPKEAGSQVHSDGSAQSATPSADLSVAASSDPTDASAQFTAPELALSQLVIRECQTTPLVHPAVSVCFPLFNPCRLLLSLLR